MTIKDDEIQRKLDQGLPIDVTSADERAYQQVFRVLEKPSNLRLPAEFADKVLDRITKEKAATKQLSDYWLIGTGAFLLITCFIVAMVIVFSKVTFRPTAGFLTYVSDYKGLFVLGIALVIVFHYLEKKLLRASTKARQHWE
jgi:hypothetical protein